MINPQSGIQCPAFPTDFGNIYAEDVDEYIKQSMTTDCYKNAKETMSPEEFSDMILQTRRQFVLDKFFNGLNTRPGEPLIEACRYIGVNEETLTWGGNTDIRLRPHQVIGKSDLDEASL
jgi:hypothetical protein